MSKLVGLSVVPEMVLINLLLEFRCKNDNIKNYHRFSKKWRKIHDRNNFEKSIRYGE